MGARKLTYNTLYCIRSYKEINSVHTELPNRYESTNEYRYRFNGMEKDDEIKGERNSYTTEFRQYDSRIGRWLSIDPVTHAYFSPYSAFDNNPINISDPSGADGESKTHTVKKGETLSSLSKKYGVSQQAIIDANSGDNGQWSKKDRSQNWLYSGETLIIPNYNVKTDYMKGDVIDLDVGKIEINEFGFSPDKEMPMIQVNFNFTPQNNTELTQEDSPYRWVQTFSSNENYNSNYDYPVGEGPNTDINRLDITDRYVRTSAIGYTQNGMYLDDILGRLVSDTYTVYWQAETSLIKVSSDGTVEILITLTWGFTIEPNGTGVSTGLNLKNSPSEFHKRMINTNERNDNYSEPN